MIVVDTNTLAYLLIPGEYTAAARATLARDAEWAAPLLWRSEFRNLLAVYMRQGHLSLAQAVALQETAEMLLAGREYGVDSRDVLTLSAESGRSAYDCEFAAVARTLNVRLVTSDAQVLRSFPDLATSLQAFGADGLDA